MIEEGDAFSLPADSYRDRAFMDWILSNKSGEEETTDDFNELLYRQHLQLTQKGVSGLATLFSSTGGNNIADKDSHVEALIASNTQEVDN